MGAVITTATITGCTSNQASNTTPKPTAPIVLGIEQKVKGTNDDSYSFCDENRKGFLFGCAEVTAKTEYVEKALDLNKVFANDPIATINFDFDSDILTTANLQKLDDLDMDLLDGKTIILRGYTDSIGKQDYNERLAQRRALAVKNYLTDILNLPNDIQALGYGLCCYVVPNTTESNRELNRRVDIYID